MELRQLRYFVRAVDAIAAAQLRRRAHDGSRPGVPAPGAARPLVKVLNAPDIRAALREHGLGPMPGSRDELARFIGSESRTWGKVIAECRTNAN